MGYILRVKPYTRKQVEAFQDKHGFTSGVISVDLSDIIENDFEGLMDIFEGKLVADGILSDISYTVVGTGGAESIHVRVSADVVLL